MIGPVLPQRAERSFLFADLVFDLSVEFAGHVLISMSDRVSRGAAQIGDAYEVLLDFVDQLLLLPARCWGRIRHVQYFPPKEQCGAV